MVKFILKKPEITAANREAQYDSPLLSPLPPEAQREELLKSVHADVAIISGQNSIYFAPLKKLNWHVVYQDKNAVVLLPM